MEDLQARIDRYIAHELEFNQRTIDDKTACKELITIAENNMQDAIMDDMQGYIEIYQDRIRELKKRL